MFKKTETSQASSVESTTGKWVWHLIGKKLFKWYYDSKGREPRTPRNKQENMGNTWAKNNNFFSSEILTKFYPPETWKSKCQVSLLWKRRLIPGEQKRFTSYLVTDKEQRNPQEMRNLAVHKMEGSQCHLPSTKLMIFYVN